MKHVSKFPRKVVEHQDMGIIMSDGCRISARVWIPEDAEDHPVPVILEHIPYRKRDGTIQRDEYNHPWFAGHGYACIRTDIRGNGESEGFMEDEYTPQELQDACEIIAWAAEQSWCNGKVGMIGISWGGFNGLQVAALQPPALKAIVTVCSTVDRYADDIHFKGGCYLGKNYGWATTMLSYSSRPPDPALVGEKWKEIWLNRLERMPYNWFEWTQNQHRNDYWKHGSVCEDYTSIKAATLSVGGWHDGYRNTISHLVANLESPVKGIVGPWIHKYPNYAGPEPAIGFLQECKRWWDRWLKDEDTGVEDDPAYRVWLMDSLKPKRWFDTRPGRWIAESRWPSENISNLVFRLGENGLHDTAQPLKTSVCSSHDCGLHAGEYFPFTYSDEFPGEQSVDDAQSACFDGPNLEETLDIVGAPVFHFKAISNKNNAQLVVRLCDLRPDGTSAFITHGVLNLTHRNSHEYPEPLIPGEEFEAVIHLDQIAYRIPAGHRLRIAVSTAYWPYIWPSPETSEVTLTQGNIEIPSRPLADGDEWTFEAPEGATPWKAENLRKSSYERECFVDGETGISHIKIFIDHGEDRDSTHGLISGSWSKEHWQIKPDDPNSAIGEIEWEQTGGRDNSRWQTSVVTRMWSDAEQFHSTATVRAFENDELVFEKTYEEAIERDLV